MSAVLADAVDVYRRSAFLEAAAIAYAASDSGQADADQALWESTLADGLTD